MGKVGAPYGNKNAEKWTLRKAVQLFHDAIELTNRKEESVIKVYGESVKVKTYEFDFIGEIAGELGTYHKLITRDLPNRFPSLKRLKEELINNLERNCYSNTKKGAIKEATGIVNLKSNHKWRDRVETEHSGQIKTTTEQITPQKAKEISDALEDEC
jgi:hypothetical protein